MNFSTNNIKIGKVNTYGNNVGAKINFGSTSNLKIPWILIIYMRHQKKQILTKNQ